MSATLLAPCFFCDDDEIKPVSDLFGRNACHECREEYAPGTIRKAAPQPAYEAPRLVMYGATEPGKEKVNG